jgi:hypothetical protein
MTIPVEVRAFQPFRVAKGWGTHFRAARYELQVLFAPLRNDNSFYTLEERKGPAFLQALSCFWLEG